jgi:hypothetical protein
MKDLFGKCDRVIVPKYSPMTGKNLVVDVFD